MPRVFAATVVRLRYLVVAAWIAAAAATTVYLPGLGNGEPLELGGLIPDDSPAVEAGARSQELFAVPLIADTAVVERDPQGLSAEEQAASSSGPSTPRSRRRAATRSLRAPGPNTKELFPG